MAKRILPYDMSKPYKLIVSQTGNIIIQNGIAYQYGSGKSLGAVATLLKDQPNKAIIFCQFSGATFPNTDHGREALKEYQERKGYLDKPADGKRKDKESTLEERKAVVMARRESLTKASHE